MSLSVFRNLVVAGFAVAALAGCGEEEVVAATPAEDGIVVNATGCAVAAADGCMTIADGPAIYDLGNASPKPDLSRGVAISVTGRDRGETNACGKVLANVKYDYLGFRCDVAPPESAAAAPTPAG